MAIPDPIIGKKLGDYTIQELLGRGGMARVYKGYDETLDRLAAVKVITSDFVATADEAEYKERFLREARAIARLRHPNIVGVYQFGELEGLYYMAMVFLDGDDLRVMLKKYAEENKRMPFDDVLKMAREVASALDYAHAQGVIHRDIKPSNIMMTSTGASLTDFGLALSTAEGTMGDTFGSAHYIAPEQAISSARAVPQSDLYSLGVVLYESFAGQVPFDDPSVMSVALKHLNEPPPPPTLYNPEIPPQIEKVLLRVLSKEPKNRYETGQELVEALETALRGGDADTVELDKASLQPADESQTEPNAPINDSLNAYMAAVKEDSPEAQPAAAPAPPPPPPPQPSSSAESAEKPEEEKKPQEEEKRKLPVFWMGIGVLAVIAAIIAILVLGSGDDEEAGLSANEQTETAIAAMPTATETSEPTATDTIEPTATEMSEPTATDTVEPTEITPGVVSSSGTEDETGTPDATATSTPGILTATDTVEPTETETVEPTATDTVEPTETETVEPTATDMVEPTETETAEPTATDTVEPTETPTEEVTPTNTPMPSTTPSPTETPLPPEIELRYITDRFVLENISRRRQNISRLVFDDEAGRSFAASDWSEVAPALSLFQTQACVSLVRTRSVVLPWPVEVGEPCYNSSTWLLRGFTRAHFWVEHDDSTTFAVKLNGETIAECPVTRSDTVETVCQFAIP